MKIPNLLKELKLSKVAREELDKVLALPEVKSVFKRDEDEALTQRAAAVAALAAVPKKYARQLDEATKIVITAAKCLEDAKAKVPQQQQEYTAASAAVNAVETAQRLEDFYLREELREGADSRLTEFVLNLRVINDLVRAEWRLIEYKLSQSTYFGPSHSIEFLSNDDEIKQIREAIAKAMTACEQMQFEAVSGDDVAQRLTTFSQELEPMITKLSEGRIVVPWIDAGGHVVMDRPQSRGGEIRQGVGRVASPQEKTDSARLWVNHATRR
jgi:hypothetical protein